MSSNESPIRPISDVAVIGAGPAGLACAAHLLRQGLAPVVYEAAAAVGGQWNGDAPGSATWRGMRTNTSRVMTVFADLDHRPGTATYPTREEMFDYLRRYADTMAVTPHIRFRTRVENVERNADGWLVTSTGEDGPRREVFARVIVANGRHRAPSIPRIPGLETFAGRLGVTHAGTYDGEMRHRGATVVVAGCSISALEIASALAYGGAGRVIVSRRRQRYVLPKLNAGLPTDHLMFNRAAMLASERLPPTASAAGLKAAVVRAGGDPAPYGAGTADPDVFVAGISQSQHFLAAVAEGRIEMRPWIASVDGRVVRFTDGDTAEADAVLFGTGYRLSVPFLADDVARTLGLDEGGLDLADHTFHPDLPGLAFVGLYDLVGPYLPVLELQARWVAYTFAGLRPAPSNADLREGLVRGRAARAMGPPPMHALAILFARRAGVEPNPRDWPDLERTLLFGPLSPASFRLVGSDARADAAARTAEAGCAFGRDGGNAYTAEEAALRDLLLGERTDIAA